MVNFMLIGFFAWGLLDGLGGRFIILRHHSASLRELSLGMSVPRLGLGS